MSSQPAWCWPLTEQLRALQDIIGAMELTVKRYERDQRHMRSALEAMIGTTTVQGMGSRARTVVDWIANIAREALEEVDKP